MCNNFTCPLCREPINNNSIIWQSIQYGIKNKFHVRIEVHYVNISQLSEEEREDMELVGASIHTFMNEDDWNNLDINQEIMEKINITKKHCIMKVNDPDEWEYFNFYNKVYLFN